MNDTKNFLFVTLTFILTYLEVKGQTKIIVVGGGLSGVTAARNLVNKNYDVTVLEARSRPGGRIWTYDLYDSSVDLGCGFIFPGANDFFNKTIDFRLSLNNVTILNCEVRDATTDLKETATFVQSVLLAMVNLQKVHSTFDATLSISEALRDSRVEEELKNRGGSAWTVGKHIMEVLMGGDFDKMSIKTQIPSDELQKVIHVIKDGMQTFIESMIIGKTGEDEVKIMYNSPVTKIVQRDTRIEVTSNGIIYTAAHVVVAVPAAVLKAKKIQFVPALGPARLTALARVGVGVVNKLVLEFDAVFWGTGPVHFVGFLPEESDNTSSLIYWLNYHHVTKKPVLVGFLTGQESINSETMSAEAVRDKGLAVLRKMFGEAKVNARTLVTYYSTRWGSDEFSLGSHVFRTPDMTSFDFEELAKSRGKLHFAGDYTFLEDRGVGTITGAYYSGRVVVQNILYLDDFVTPSTEDPSTPTTTLSAFTTPTDGPRPVVTENSSKSSTSAANMNRIELIFLLYFMLMNLCIVL